MGLIVALAIGIPLLLLGGCAAVVLIVGDTSTGREALVTTASSPNAAMPSRLAESAAPEASAPEASAPAETAAQGPTTTAVGDALTLQGSDPALKVTVTVTKVVNPATPADEFMKPKPGNKFVAVELTLTNAGTIVYSDAPTNGALLIDGEGQQYRTTLFRVREGQSLNGSTTIIAGDTRRGVIAFEVPEAAKLAKLQFALNSGFADQKGEWTLP
ncbi:DUF4352 domain-containing protein [Actinomadura sp. ATCC 39365]